MSIPLLLSALSSNILHSSDKIIISKYCGTNQTALYSVAVTIASISTVLWVAMNRAWAPWLLDNLHQENFNRIKKVSVNFSLFYAGLIIGLMLIAPEILYFMGGEKYILCKQYPNKKSGIKKTKNPTKTIFSRVFDFFICYFVIRCKILVIVFGSYCSYCY